jgi:hypothetical protein
MAPVAERFDAFNAGSSVKLFGAIDVRGKTMIIRRIATHKYWPYVSTTVWLSSGLVLARYILPTLGM